MEHRGHILIVFGLSLVLTPLAIKSYQDRAAEDSVREVSIVTDGARTASCRNASVETAIGRLGCQNGGSSRTPSRTMSGGAMFVSAAIN